MKHVIEYPRVFSSRVLAFTADDAMDFHFERSTPELKPQQKAFLKEQANGSIDRLFNIQQIHGRRVVLASWPQARIPKADAAMTDQPGVALAVRTADCVPVFLWDEKHQAIGLIHAGWRSALKEIVPNVVFCMRKKFGTHAKNLKVALGPSIQKCCYEVSQPFEKYFPGFVKKRKQARYLDLPGFIRHQLRDLGAGSGRITQSTCCTFCDHRFFSYRRQGPQTGRLLSLMMIK